MMKELPALKLPVTANEWRDHFEKFFKRARDIEDVYDSARACELEFKADELGAFSVQCERAFTPLRWIVRRVARGQTVTLHDDMGDAASLTVVRLAFETPDIEKQLEPASTYEVPTAGGMYVARRSDLSAGVIVPPAVRGFADLRRTPRLSDGTRSPDAVLRMLRLSSLWACARVSGNVFSAFLQCEVLRALTRHIFLLFGGKEWAEAERAMRDGKSTLGDLKRSVSKRRDEVGVGAALALEGSGLATTACAQRVARLSGLVTRFLHLTEAPAPQGGHETHGPDDPAWLCELALRLASDPLGAQAWAGSGLAGGVAQLLEQPTVARAARFLVIAIDHHFESRTAAGQLYAGWPWT